MFLNVSCTYLFLLQSLQIHELVQGFVLLNKFKLCLCWFLFCFLRYVCTVWFLSFSVSQCVSKFYMLLFLNQCASRVLCIRFLLTSQPACLFRVFFCVLCKFCVFCPTLVLKVQSRLYERLSIDRMRPVSIEPNL